MKKIFAVLALLGTLGLALPVLAQDKRPRPRPRRARLPPPLRPQHPQPRRHLPQRRRPRPRRTRATSRGCSSSTAFVLMMSVPALALFYGGMVRSKNVLSVLMQVFVVFSLISVLWCVYGYSLAFTEGNAYFGSFDRLFLKGTFDSSKGEFAMAATFSKNTPIPELVYVAFQATFAAITVCLVLGAFAERIKFSAVLVFSVLWFTFSYLPIAHMVWFWPGPDAYTAANVVDATNAKAGLIWQWGALDFAGGTVVHINAGIAGIVGAYVMGKRIGFGKESMAPANLPMTMMGASLLWMGWFGFNAGSALEANNSAALAFINTYLATACAVLSWTFGEWVFKGKPSMLGAASGAVAGLVAITPAAGNVGIPGAFVIGIAGRPRLPVGRQRPEAHAEGRRHARRVRRPRGRRDSRRVAHRHLRVARSRRSERRVGLGHRQDGVPGLHGAAHHPGEGRGHDDRVVGRRRLRFVQDRRHDHRPARAGRTGARRARYHVARRIRVPELRSASPASYARADSLPRPRVRRGPTSSP